MGSNQPGLNHSDRNNADATAAIPHFARAWESEPKVFSVRRPSVPPDPQLYHEVIEPEAIFELDAKQAGGSIETILVVPFGCKRCKSQKQACSRMRPACLRCRKAGLTCDVARGGYQRLPRPRVGRPSMVGKRNTRGIRENSVASSSATPGPTTGRTRIGRIASGSKRPLSPGSDSVPPRKKSQVKKNARKGKKRCDTVASDEEMDAEWSEGPTEGPSAQAVPMVEPAGEHSALQWAFVDNARIRTEMFSQGEEEHAHSVPFNTPVPRVWTNSLDSLLTVYPELAKSTVGFSWLQSETPILLLDTNYARGHWIDSTTLSIDLLWDFFCYDVELEPVIESDTGRSVELPSCQSMVHSPENTLGREAEMMESQNSCSPSGTRLFPTPETASASTSDVRVSSPDLTPKYEQYTHEFHARAGSPIHDAASDDLMSAMGLTLLYPSSPLSPPENSPISHPHSAFDESHTHRADLQPRIPLHKPPEVETLLDSRLRFIPLLLWIAHDSELVPCKLVPEYLYSCMGLFFVSDLHHAVVQYEVSSVTGVAQGRVCWSVTLQWAPGGEGALFDCNAIPSSNTTSDPDLDSVPLCTTRDLLHPWWFHPPDTSSQTDDSTPYRPKDLRMQVFSCIPLDLIAEFHPSEIFPRGWFCKSCGMINIQEFFRHQICQSTMCGSRCEKYVPQGKATPLSSFRDLYQSSTLLRPTNNIPPTVICDRTIWEDGMQSWSYGIKDGGTLCHVFTGNQEHLQQDATALLESIQCDVPLRKEDRSSPYFIHTTRLLHPRDGPETMVPVGTPDCVRIAYYTLCDLVHRYGEMDKPRFGQVRLQAWVNSGSKKANVFRASKSPAVIHCLGAEVVLKFIPKEGYNDIAEPTASDKGKGRAKDENCTGLGPTEPCAGPSRHSVQDFENHASIIPRPEASELPIGAENVGEPTAAADVVRQGRSSDAGSAAITDSNAAPEMEAACHEVAEPKQGDVYKKKKVTKDKSKGISMTLVHGDCVVLYGDDFECQIVRIGTTILVIGFPEET